MPFVISKDDEALFLQEQAGLPARIVGLIFPVLIDRRVEAIIKSRWRDDTPKKMLGELFRDGGPLGSFQTRVHIGHAIGLYDENMYADIKRIVKIRNEFAHEPGANSFDDQPICDFTRSLTLPEQYPKSDTTFVTTIRDKSHFIDLAMASSGLIDLAPLQTRYLRAVELVLTWLSIESGELNYDQEPPATWHYPST